MFPSCRKCSESTAESRKSPGSEFQTVGPAKEKAGASQRAAANTLKRVDDTRQIIDAGDRELQTQPGTEDNDGPSRRACTVPSEEQSASALAVTDHARALSPSDKTCCSIGNCMQLVCDFFGRQTKTTLQ